MPVLDFDCRVGSDAETALYVFAVRAAQEPQVMLRVAGLFAQRNIIPRQLCCRTSGSWLLIDVEVRLESGAVAQLLLEKMRSIVCVDRVNLVEGKC